MATHYTLPIRPRSLKIVLDDLKEASRDYHEALAADDEDAEDRATEAETRLEDVRSEFNAKLIETTGLSFEALMKAREEALI